MIHLSSASPALNSFLSPEFHKQRECDLPPIGTPKHMQIAAVQWNREAIAQAKANLDVNGMSSWSHLYLTCVDVFCCAHGGVVPEQCDNAPVGSTVNHRIRASCALGHRRHDMTQRAR